MKQFQTVYRGENAFRTTVSEWQLHCAHKPVLIRLFSDGADPSEISSACAIIDELMRISGLIHEAIRKLNINASDGRWSGEGFMLMLPGMTREAAAVFAEEIRQEIEKLRFEKCGKVSASFGVAQAMPEEDADPLVVRADTALYKAKASGKNTVCQAQE